MKLVKTSATEAHWWQVNVGSSNTLVTPGNKPLPEQILTHIQADVSQAGFCNYIPQNIVGGNNLSLPEIHLARKSLYFLVHLPTRVTAAPGQQIVILQWTVCFSTGSNNRSCCSLKPSSAELLLGNIPKYVFYHFLIYEMARRRNEPGYQYPYYWISKTGVFSFHNQDD